MSEKPTILLVHGSWHPPIFYTPFLALLSSLSYPILCPPLPTLSSLPPTGLTEDTDLITTTLKDLIETSHKKVIILAHSYGGIVTTQSANTTFSLSHRASQGLPGGIIHILYISAWLVPPGSSLGSMLGYPDALPPFIPTDEQGMCIMSDPENIFYNDLPEDERKYWADKLVKCPAVAQLTEVTYPGYAYHPGTYLLCEKDQGIPVELQEKMVKDVEDGYNVEIRRVRCDAGHSPFLSQPKTIVDIVERIAQECGV
ncbi:hypothetical protein AA313_de0203582 [Arthrobotrys entomopaga]|nr:hypothetical protein AA313_de0203582 [Arthrobotrys entomopaga]